VNLLTISWHFIIFYEIFHTYYEKLHDLTCHEHVHDTKIHEQVLESVRSDLLLRIFPFISKVEKEALFVEEKFSFRIFISG
jgi:hypothetical protein